MIKIAWMYPDTLYLHGERGNALALKHFSEVLGGEAVLDKVDFETKDFDPMDYDILFFAPGEVSSFEVIGEDMDRYMDRLKEFIKNMKYNNIKVSIDDFGTGYSSLGLLKDLKVNVIKIDQSFVRGLDTPEMSSESDMIVLRNVIRMIRELDMKVIAEGVETSEEADFLKGADCVMAQGFLFDKPMPRDEYELVLKGKRTY